MGSSPNMPDPPKLVPSKPPEPEIDEDALARRRKHLERLRVGRSELRVDAGQSKTTGLSIPR